MRPALFAKLTWLEAKLFLREPLAVGFTIAYPLVVMFVIAGVFNRPGEEIRGVGGAEYYVVSNIAVVIAAMGLIALPPTPRPTSSAASSAGSAPRRCRRPL